MWKSKVKETPCQGFMALTQVDIYCLDPSEDSLCGKFSLIKIEGTILFYLQYKILF